MQKNYARCHWYKLVVRGDERVWIKNQSDGDLDDGRIIDVGTLSRKHRAVFNLCSGDIAVITYCILKCCHHRNDCLAAAFCFA